ncbi:MAG TPA: hypothetical protein VGR08_06280 [Thermomicrobiales bacterium]|nr:hypothetical protein [Thermomicrobiales bacterium]
MGDQRRQRDEQQDEHGEDGTMHERFIDHERLALERFRCPSCGLPLELIEMRRPIEEQVKDPDAITLIAACRSCEIGFTKEDWHRRRVA